MIQCAHLAGIHEEIKAMPMTYNSLIGDMGSSLSADKNRRLMLTRAQPRIFFLDELTTGPLIAIRTHQQVQLF
jgi:ATP-binding cassette subfamily B protein RaxB